MQGTYIPPEDNKDPLETYTINMTTLARDGKLDPVIGRDEEIRRIIQILSRRTKNNPVLLGDPGVGKTAILEGLASRIVSGDVPTSLQNKELLSLDISSLLAGASYRGQFEERFKGLIGAIEKGEGKYILFIDELHTIVGAGGAEGAVDAGNMLKPSLARGTLRTIGATTLREYRQYIEKDPALERRFQPVLVDEPSREATLAILRGIKEKYENHHGVKITDDALISAVSMSIRYLPDRFLPDKAIDLIDEAASSARIETDSLPTKLDEMKRRLMQLDIELAALKSEKGVDARKDELKNERNEIDEKLQNLMKIWETEKKILKELSLIREKLDKKRTELEIAEREINLEKAASLKYSEIPNLEKELVKVENEYLKIPLDDRLLRDSVDREDIATIISKWTHIPVTRLLASESNKLLGLEDNLAKKVIGQTDALHSLAKAIRRSRVGLSDETKPIGSFLLLGPTGVGKTETAKALALAMFEDSKALVRLDMSEYCEAHSVARLIGAPPGYVGYAEGGQLTETIRRRPYAVILLDEIEKAHPQIFNVLLQILDDGQLTDGKGRVVSFKQTIILMTSNLGSTSLLDETDFQTQKNQIEDSLRQFFKPEFLNRLDGKLYYLPLSKDTMIRIVAHELTIVKALLQKSKLNIEFDTSVHQHLLNLGFDPLYGARPLKRLINDLIVDEIATLLLEEKIHSEDKLYCYMLANKIKIDKVKSE